MKKTNGIQSEIIAFTGDTVTLKLYDRIDEEKARKLRINGKYLTLLDIYEPGTITDEQRRHYFALAGDFANFTGYPTQQADSFFKDYFMRAYELDEWPSLARGAMEKSVASDLIGFIIEFMIQNDIPFRKQQFYLTTDVSKMLYAMTMKRLCWICGRPGSSLHHATKLVGMGRDRTKYNHLQSKFMTLCEFGVNVDDETQAAAHHREADQMGLANFCNKYHVKPIKLTKDDLDQLNIKGKYEEA